MPKTHSSQIFSADFLVFLRFSRPQPVAILRMFLQRLSVDFLDVLAAFLGFVLFCRFESDFLVFYCGFSLAQFYGVLAFSTRFSSVLKFLKSRH
jgi:hypothetical protein